MPYDEDQIANLESELGDLVSPSTEDVLFHSQDYDAGIVGAIATRMALAGGGVYQPVDADLSAIAALATTAYGRGLLTLADLAALYTALAVDTDGTLAANSDAKLASQKAVKTYINTNRAPAKQTMLCFGDSITGANYSASGAESYGYWTHARMRLGQRFLTVGNSGVGGNTTAQMLARIQADVVALAPGWVVVQGGSNDVTNAVSSATIIANLTDIYTTLRTAGITVVATTILPTVNADTAGEKLIMQTANEWIRGYARSTPGIILCDWAAWIANPTTGDPATGMTTDGVHPSQQGAYLLGKALADVLGPLTFPAARLPISNAEAGLVLPNPRLVGNSSGVATSTTIATDGTGTMTNSKVARTDGIQGEWQQVVIAGANQLVRVQQQSTTNVGAGNVSVGDYVYATAEVQIDAGATMVGQAGEVPVSLLILNQDAGTVSLTDGYAASGLGTYAGGIPTGLALVLRTPNFLLVAGSSRLYVRVLFGVNGTVRVGRMQLYKSTAVSFYG